MPSPSDFLPLAAHMPVLDVRSPGEYAAGHLPGAVSMPLFSDEERALVGTAYKQEGHLPAYRIGLEVVGPKMAAMVAQAEALAGPGGQVGLYCWRGGMRSGSVGWLLQQGGFEVVLLRGGYKAYRGLVRQTLERPWPLRLVAGYTGSGKTDLLRGLARLGEQVIDLEALAHHKGSAFGGIGQGEQPRIEMFENELAARLLSADPTLPIWLEDESQSIGKVFIYAGFFAQMQQAPAYVVDVPQEVRVDHLVADYAGLPVAELAAAITRIAKRMGPQHAKAALELLEVGDFAQVARLTLAYYDKCYRPTGRPVASIPLSGPDMEGEAAAFLQQVQGLEYVTQ